MSPAAGSVGIGPDRKTGAYMNYIVPPIPADV